MVELAIKHQKELQEKLVDTWLDDRYKFYHAANFYDNIQIADSTWTAHQFVSVADGEVIGYIGYQIDRSCDYVYNLGILNFTDKVNAVFAKDLGMVLRDIFEKYHFRRLEWTVVSGNPIENSYDKICKKYGGRIVGTYKGRIRLIDGKFYDEKLYELDHYAYFESIKSSKKRKQR